MKKQLFIFITILCYQISFSQNDTVYISGKVTAENSYRNGEAVKNALIHLKLSNGGMFESKSNDTGYYFLKVKTFQGAGELTIATDKNTSFINSKTYGFLASKNDSILDFNKSMLCIKNFALTKITICWSFPTILFKYNSTESLDKYSSSREESADSSINFINSVLNEDPTMVIELQGHCDSREKNPDTLSLQRADYLRQALINKGIDKERVLIKGWGAKKLLVKDSVILKATTKEEKEKLHLQNRRVILRIINWDYIPKENNKSPK